MQAKPIAGAAALAIAGVFAAGAGHAIDVSPGDYGWVGDGRTLVLGYGQFQSADEFLPDGAGAVPDSKLSLSLLLLRGVHYRQIGGHKFSVQAILPVARFGTARIGGADAPVSDGIGDLTLGASWYPLASSAPTGTTLGVTAFLTAPTGAYEFGEVSLGSGTWTLTPQIGLIQGLGGGLFFDGILDVAIQRDHTESGVVVSRDASVQTQAYLRGQHSPGTKDPRRSGQAFCQSLPERKYPIAGDGGAGCPCRRRISKRRHGAASPVEAVLKCGRRGRAGPLWRGDIGSLRAAGA